jgi:hypothetical protein
VRAFGARYRRRGPSWRGPKRRSIRRTRRRGGPANAPADAGRTFREGSRRPRRPPWEPSLTQEGRDPGFDLVEECNDVTVVVGPQRILAGRRGSRGMEVSPSIVRTRVSVPAALPGVGRGIVRGAGGVFDSGVTVV